MPERHHSWAQKVKLQDAHGVLQTFHLTFGEREDGSLGSVTIDTQKDGTFTRGVLQTLSVAVSLALQCGATPLELARALRGLNFPPRGKVLSETSPVKEASSIADWIAQEIESAYCTGGVD